MKKISKKIGIIIFFLCINLLFIQHISISASWVKTSPSFKRATFNNYGWTGGSDYKTYVRKNNSSGRLVITSGKKGISISSPNSTKSRKFYTKKNKQGKIIEGAIPKLDKNAGVLCLQHEKSSSSGSLKIRSNILVDGRNITFNPKTSKASNKTSSVAAKIAYIICNTNGTASSSARQKNGTQGALWRHTSDYYKTFTSEKADASFTKDVNKKGTAYYKWAHNKNAKTIYKYADEYGAMPTTNLKFSNKNYKVWKSSGNNYIIGPFRATFANYTTSNRIYAGEYNSKIAGKYQTSGWSFCNANGSNITPSSGADFYIKVPKSWFTTNNTEFVFATRRLNVKAEWWDINHATASQDHMYLVYAFQHYLEESDKTTLTPPSLKIIKTDKNTGKVLQGMQFKIKNEKGYYLTEMPNNGLAVFGSTNIAQAMTFTTDAKGQFTIPRIETGTYSIIETGVGNNWQYEAVGLIDTVNINGPGVITKSITNKKAFINLSGYVWEDKEHGKENQKNGLYKDTINDENDKLLANVSVKLTKEGKPVRFKDNKGKEITEIKTDSNGKYKLYKVRIEDLEKLAVEFTYNGMSYKNVATNINKSNGSKAEEGANRIAYNERYTSIAPGVAINSKGNQTAKLNYDSKNYESKLNYGKNSIYGYQGQEFPINGTDENFLIQATTKGTYDLRGGKTIDQIRASGLEEITNVNLGVTNRTQPNLKVVKDINSAKVTINHTEHVYRYGDRNNIRKMEDIYKKVKEQTGTEVNSPYQIPPKVKFETPYANMSYTRALYPSDVYYKDPEDKEDNNLRVKVIYQIGILNQASSLKTIVNEIDDYYDSKYIQADTKENRAKIKIGRKIDAVTGEVSQTDNDKLEYELQKSNDSKYYKIHIKNINLEAVTSTNSEEGNHIYVQLEVEQSQIQEIVTANENDNTPVKLDNIAEITSYSTKDENNAPYAGIDKKSAPGNVALAIKETYEEDTDQAPGLKLVLGEERKTTGKVFIDKVEQTDKEFNPNGVNYAKIRQGNGIYDKEEQGVEGVTVELVDSNTLKTVEIHEKDKQNQWEEAKKITNSKGEFIIEGFIPSHYILKYTWGGQSYYENPSNKTKNEVIRVQDYKGTIYNDLERQNNVEWYKLENHYNDAKDDYKIREKIDQQSSMITNENKETIKKYLPNGKIKVQNSNGKEEKQDLITQMNSYTPKFRVNLEYNTKPSNGEETVANHIQNMDFGIVQRAKQQLELNKNITRTKVTLPNGNLLIDAKIENGKLKDMAKYTTYIPQSTTLGQLKLEIDKEILQNAILEIEYELKVKNKSEIDYKNQDFYWYGRGHGDTNQEDLIALNANTVIDYLDNNLSNNSSSNESNDVKNTGWKTYTTDEKKQLIENGLLAKSLQDTLNVTATVIATNNLGENLQPQDGKDEKTMTLKAYKMLPSVLKEEDTNFGNNAEIIKITKTGGSTLTTTPGNYDPSKGPPAEVDESTAEAVTIVPPTGLDINVIAYTLLAISSLGILTTGIILIRKLVLK